MNMFVTHKCEKQESAIFQFARWSLVFRALPCTCTGKSVSRYIYHVNDLPGKSFYHINQHPHTHMLSIHKHIMLYLVKVALTTYCNSSHIFTFNTPPDMTREIEGRPSAIVASDVAPRSTYASPPTSAPRPPAVLRVTPASYW